MKTTKLEIVKIITAIKTQCPDALQYKTDEELDIIVDMWHEVFKGYPKEVVWTATRNALRNTEYQRQNWLGAISKEIDKMQSSFQATDNELWDELRVAARHAGRCAYYFQFNAVQANGLTQGENARKEVDRLFDGLSPELKEYCRSVRGLIEIAEYTDEQMNFERGRFMRTMPQLRERAKVRQQMPETIAGLLQGHANRPVIGYYDEIDE